MKSFVTIKISVKSYSYVWNCTRISIDAYLWR